MMRHTVEHDAELLAVLRLMYPASSSTKLRKMLTQGRVLVNDDVVHRAKHSVASGDTVDVIVRQRAEERPPPPPPPTHGQTPGDLGALTRPVGDQPPQRQ